MLTQQTNFKSAVRLATTSDFEEVADLFSSHYASDLTSRDPGSSERLLKELEGMRDGSSIIVVAIHKGQIIGAGIATLERDFSKYELELKRRTAYLSKNVVHEEYRRSGLGKLLVGARLDELRNRGIDVVYPSHHSDNIGSAKALDAFGFEYVDSYFDPEKRLTGSQMTTVRRVLLYNN